MAKPAKQKVNKKNSKNDVIVKLEKGKRGRPKKNMNAAATVAIEINTDKTNDSASNKDSKSAVFFSFS